MSQRWSGTASLLYLMALAACDHAAPSQELSRSRDPTGRLDAVVVVQPADSLSTDPVYVLLKRSGEPIHSASPLIGSSDEKVVFSARDGRKTLVDWKDAATLHIYSEAIGLHTRPDTVTVSDGKTRRTIKLQVELR